MTSVNDVFTYSVAGSGTKDFTLKGGAYGVAIAATGWGTVSLSVLAANRTTYVPYASWTANTAADFNLTAGSYRFTYSVTTASLSIAQQPNPGWVATASLPLPVSSTGGATTYSTMPSDTSLNITSGTGGVTITSGSTDDANSGLVYIASGAADGTGNTGDVGMESAQPLATGNSGGIFVGSSGAPAGSSGNLGFYTGNASGSGKTVGDIRFDIGNAASSATAGNWIITNLPTSASGLPSGAIWNNSGTLKIVA